MQTFSESYNKGNPTRELLEILRNLKIDYTNPYAIIVIRDILTQLDDLLDDTIYQQKKTKDLLLGLVGEQLYNNCKSTKPNIHDNTYQWLGQYLYSHILNWLQQEENIAEELANQALFIIATEIQNEKVKSPQGFLHWVKQIAYHEAVNYLRKNKLVQSNENLPKNSNELPVEETQPVKSLTKVREVLGVDALEEIAAPEHQNPEKIVLAEERRKLLYERVLQMKANTKRGRNYQYILIASFFLDLPDVEIAANLKISVKEVQKQRYQALEILRRDIKWFNDLLS